ncbi:MAG: sigma-70 family RNA polymerase sigma factor [Candidatus Margulisbacteria bacterium]|jgi:RNA polymerase sigma factor (sigma-70 family)|nr:sigma-70 family RNA polymerase sigma factor [Candidatus Margulisiibacteriota bacterium]
MRVWSVNLKSYADAVRRWGEKNHLPSAPLSSADRQRIIDQYKRFIVKQAQKYEYKMTSFAFEDMVQEGMVGLLEALNSYDPAQKAAFLTFASYRINGAMLDALRDRGSIIKLTRSQQVKIKELGLAEDYLCSVLDRQPTENEVAQFLGLDLAELNEIKMCRQRRLPLETETEKTSWVEKLPDKHDYEASDRRHELMLQIEKSIEYFLLKCNKRNKERNRYILRRCCGIISGPENTNKAIAKEVGLTESFISLTFKQYREFLRTQTWFKEAVAQLGLL